jgi:hypothetical protein
VSPPVCFPCILRFFILGIFFQGRETNHKKPKKRASLSWSIMKEIMV